MKVHYMWVMSKNGKYLGVFPKSLCSRKDEVFVKYMPEHITYIGEVGTYGYGYVQVPKSVIDSESWGAMPHSFLRYNYELDKWEGVM